MANNETTLYQIVNQMDQSWISFRCMAKEGQTNFNGFLFGWKQEVDDIHNKDMAFMVVNPPPSSASTIQIEYEQVKTSTSFVVQIYNSYPSSQDGKSPTTIPKHWDDMEQCFYYWLNDVLIALGSRVQIGTGSVNITRTRQSSNDQWFSIECKFNLDYFRYCFDLDGNN